MCVRTLVCVCTCMCEREIKRVRKTNEDNHENMYKVQLKKSKRHVHYETETGKGKMKECKDQIQIYRLAEEWKEGMGEREGKGSLVVAEFYCSSTVHFRKECKKERYKGAPWVEKSTF